MSVFSLPCPALLAAPSFLSYKVSSEKKVTGTTPVSPKPPLFSFPEEDDTELLPLASALYSTLHGSESRTRSALTPHFGEEREPSPRSLRAKTRNTRNEKCCKSWLMFFQARAFYCFQVVIQKIRHMKVKKCTTCVSISSTVPGLSSFEF